LVSLAQGFFHAGARAVLATLWEVDDQASQELVRLFYQAFLVRHLKPAAALAAAQRAMRADTRWRDPYYWSGFVLMSGLD
jgi:CHAT domain-containing protein